MGKQHCHIVGSKKLKFNSWSSKLVVFVLNLEPAKTQYRRGHPAKRTTAEGWFSFTTGGSTKMPREQNWQSITRDLPSHKRTQNPLAKATLRAKRKQQICLWKCSVLVAQWLIEFCWMFGARVVAQCNDHLDAILFYFHRVLCLGGVFSCVYPHIQCSRSLPSSRPVVCSPDFLRFFSGFSPQCALVRRRIAFCFEVISITSCPVLYVSGVSTVIWFTS